MPQKYYLDVNTTTTVENKTLYQIVATHNITTIGGDITAGATGGYIQNEGVNLKHDDQYKVGNVTYTSWINAGSVFDNAQVTGGAYVNGAGVLIHGDAVIDGVCNITGTAEIKDKVKVTGTADVGGSAKLFESALVYGNATVDGTSSIFGNAKIYDNANLSDSVTAFGNSKIFGNTTCTGGNATTASTAVIYGDAEVYGAANLTGRQIINGITNLTT